MENKRKFFLLSIFAVLTLNPITNAQSELPLKGTQYYVQPLRSLVDESLQHELELQLNANAKWKTLIREKKLAVGLVDLSNPFQVRFARVNGNEMMYAASLPKIAILLAAVDAMEEGELKENKVILDDLRAMIRKSDNRASTRMIDLLGYEKIEEVLTDPQYELFDEDYGGGLWVGKRYAATGRKNPDPIKGLSHAATVTQVCRFYYLLSMGKLVNYERSRQMLELMYPPELHHKFVHTLDRIAPKAKVYRKSGSWRDYHSDSVLVWGKDEKRRYILVALTQSTEGEAIIRDLIYTAENVLRSKI